eukprot:snap_masked-scaffold_8-processed-gene-13.48-mRNA-1 protein AED:1.00 eAED:1.00 QI:0/0/0/0/1/1/2/0/224
MNHFIFQKFETNVFLFQNELKMTRKEQKSLIKFLKHNADIKLIILSSFEVFWSYFRGADGNSSSVVFCVEPRASLEAVNRFYYSDLYFNNLNEFILSKHLQNLSMNAYISTLGGGYFLCGFLKEAEVMAQKQFLIALKMNNIELAIQTHIHLVYNYIRRGMLKNAKRRLKILLQIASQVENEHLKNMIKAAWKHIQKLKTIKHKLMDQKQHVIVGTGIFPLGRL